MTALRTRLVWLLMRVVSHERLYAWHRRGWLAPLERVLLRGELNVLGGIGSGMHLGGASFAPWGAQAYAVLTGTHELQVQEALRRSVGAGDVVWDVGANIGALSLVAARMVGPTGRVIAVEPQAGCAAAIRANAARNDLGWIEVREVAATDHSGDVALNVVDDTLWTRLASVGEHELQTERVVVAGSALDDLDAPPPTLVKIDVEGAELEVVAGMRRVLDEAQPVVVCEMHGRNREFCAAMHEAGYDVLNLDGPEPVEEAWVNVHALCVPRRRLTA